MRVDGHNRKSWPPTRQAGGTARVALGLITAYVVIAALVAPAIAQSPTPSESGSPSASPAPTGPGIMLLNPSLAYDPGFALPARESGEPDPPKISDKFDGVNSTYHVSAAVTDPPANALAEAYWTSDDPNVGEITVCTLQQAPATTNIFECEWDIPPSVADNTGTFAVRLFAQASGGFEEVAADETAAEIQNVETPNQPRGETAEITWPTQGGPLGFFRSSKGAWRTVVEGLSSGGASQDQVHVFYSTTPFGGDEPEYVQCIASGLGGVRADGSRAFSGTCALAGKTLPTEVTSLVAVYAEDQVPNVNPPFQPVQDAADVHVFQPYFQSPADMTLKISPDQDGSYVTRRRRNQAGGDFGACIGFTLTVLDPLGRPVQGANLDVQMQGPTDQAAFGGVEDGSPAPTSGSYKAPDKGEHSSESARNCDNPEGTDEELFGPAFESSQGEHNLPGTPDVKHRESAGGGGSGVSGGRGTGFGQWRFHLYAPAQSHGIMDITAWIDEEELISISEDRPADNDVLDEGEVSLNTFAQWFRNGVTAPTISIDPPGASAPAGTCQPYTVRVLAGTDAVPDINVDVHAQGPDDALDFCTPVGGSVRRAPDLPMGANAHATEDASEAVHSAPDAADQQHTEGETDQQGNFVVGVISPVVGDTTLTAWIDGEKEVDDDVQSSETSATVTTNWASAIGDAEISFINPSGYGPGPGAGATGTGDQISAKPDADSAYHIVTRVDAPSLIGGVELLLGTGGTFTKIGDASRIGNSDIYEFTWNMAGVTDASYTLRAQIVGTSITEDRTVTVNNIDNAMDPDPNEAPLETVELTKPLDGEVAVFSNRALAVTGVASVGAEGLDLYYTKAPAKDTPTGTAWILCGYVDLSGTGAGPQTFTGTCSLKGVDQPSQVTGVAAHTYDCVQGGCNAAHPTTPNVREPGRNESGDAHRVFGLDANPIVTLEPAEIQNNIDTCEPTTLSITDQTGRPIAGLNVDVHLAGPSDSATFCDPEDGSGSPRQVPDQGGHTDGRDVDGSLHTEGQTLPNGKFIVGVTSDQVGDSLLTGWLDINGSDVQEPDERSDTSVLHWAIPGGCDIRGTEAAETIVGTSEAEKICGLGGDDIIRGFEGNDILIGGPGNDSLFGGKGNDKLRGRGGNDGFEGQGGSDNLRGGKGKDTLRGGPGDDRCEGGPQKDRLTGCESGSANRRLTRTYF